VHYAEDSTWYSALEFAKLTHDQAMTDALVKRFDPWQTEEGQQKLISWQRHVDHSIFGIVPLELYIRTKDPKYLVLARSWRTGSGKTHAGRAVGRDALLDRRRVHDHDPPAPGLPRHRR